MYTFNPRDDEPMATSVPCIAELSIGGGAEYRMYGPFINLLAARAWCEAQRPTHFRIIPLRRTDKERPRHGDWYDPDYINPDNFVDEFYRTHEVA